MRHERAAFWAEHLQRKMKGRHFLSKAKRSIALAMTFVFCVSIFASCGNIRVTTEVQGENLLKAGSETVSIGEAKLYLMTLTNEYKTLYEFNMWEKLEAAGNTRGYNELKDYMKERTMSRIQNVFCMYLLAQEKELALSQEETEKIQQAAQVFYQGLSETELEYLGVSEADVEKAYTRFALANLIYEQMTGDEVNQISDDTARVMTGYLIFVNNEETAKEIQTKLDSGAEFSSLATLYTALPSAIQNISRGAFPDPVVEAAFNLAEGENTGMVKANGYYFVECIDRMDEELTEANRQVIEREMREVAFDESYEEYLRNVYLQVSEEAWEEIEVITDDSLKASNFFTTYNEMIAE